jgi:DTW domain-containing protein YfiP
LKTKVSLIVHAKELKRTTNTGRLALHALVNSEMRVRGRHDTSEGSTALDLSDLLQPEYRSVLFYPSDEARALDSAFVGEDSRPVQLIVPDGNWRQASKVHTRHPELRELPRVMIKTPNLAVHHLRAETTQEGMATLQAIAEALGVLEGPSVKEALMSLYEAKLRATLRGRGQSGSDGL